MQRVREYNVPGVLRSMQTPDSLWNTLTRICVKRVEMDRKRGVDYELVVAYVQNQSIEAFGQLYERYQHKVYSTACQVVGDATEAMDVTQEVFLRIHRELHRFRFEASFSSWVYRLTVNLATDFRRRRRTRRMQTLDGVSEDGSPRSEILQSNESSPAVEAARRELAGDVLMTLDVLSPKLREVIVLRYLQGLSYSEVAEVLETPVGTVKSRLNRAHEKLKPGLERLSDQL